MDFVIAMLTVNAVSVLLVVVLSGRSTRSRPS